jgi:hypothetical protein
MSWTGEKQTGDLVAAIEYFHSRLPGWWFSVGACHVSADATCAPDTAGCDGELVRLAFFDSGFDVDLLPPATMADSLRRVTDVAYAARDAYYVRRNVDDAVAALAAIGIAA